MIRQIVAGLCCGLIVGVLALAGGPGAQAEPLDLSFRQVVLSYDDPAVDRVDMLVFRGGLDLRSSDRRFGGLSGLDVSPDGTRIVAVGDRGIWVAGTLAHNARGELTGLRDAEIHRLRGTDGRPLERRADTDAESLVRLPSGGFLVGFEQRHRLQYYSEVGAQARRVRTPPVLRTSPGNGGAEAVTGLRDGRLLILSEQLEARPGIAAGWVGADRDWRAVGLRRPGIYRPVGAATRDDGAVFLLERRFSTLGGIGTRVSLIPEDAIVPGTIFEGRELMQLFPPLVADNFEGISVRRNDAGETLIYIVSDDNFNDLQRTLLLLFALAE